MKGLELSRLFYEEYGAPMLHKEFPHLEGLVAVGLAGSGSECLGYDDEYSHDHDFEPGFCIFLPDEDAVDRRSAFLLERAYAKLPTEFMGYTRSPVSPVGGSRHGVIRMEDFFRERTGTPDGVLSLGDWFSLPEQSLLEAVNGAIFRDGLGQMSEIRRRLAYLPEDVRRKKLAGHLLLMGQAGQYNYPRCLGRSDAGAAQLALCEFVRSALHAAFLLNRRYLPYYKWSFYALRRLPMLSSLAPLLEDLLLARGSEDTVETVCRLIIDALRAEDLSRFEGNEMEGHAYEVNGRVEDPSLRSLHVLFGV